MAVTITSVTMKHFHVLIVLTVRLLTAFGKSTKHLVIRGHPLVAKDFKVMPIFCSEEVICAQVRSKLFF